MSSPYLALLQQIASGISIVEPALAGTASREWRESARHRPDGVREDGKPDEGAKGRLSDARAEAGGASGTGGRRRHPRQTW